ncbi:MAG: carboxypeptidase-like regulatory domain-containing protein [Chitinophagaceae bacterium]
MVTRLLVVLAGMLLSLTAFAQDIKGTVKDSTGKAVPYVSINLRTKAGNVVIAYTATDVNGLYLLKRPANVPADSLYLEARCIGYKTQIRSLTGPAAEIDFTLAVAVDELQSVIVQNTQPMLRTHGDTLNYKVSQFSTTRDRVIADVIKRLPGLTVAEDGSIRYNNRLVSGVYIGGDNLLDDKYSIATNTIPQGVVDEVQVITNHQPIKVLQNKVTSEDIAINLTFKRGSQLHLFGRESIGAGLPGKYNVDMNAMLFNDKYKGINYLKANNTGDDLQQDLVSHNGSNYQERTGYIPPATLLSLGQVNNPDLLRTRYFSGNAGVLNTNNLVNFKSGLQLRLNAYYLRNKQQQDYSQYTSIFLPGDTVRYTEEQHNQFNPSILQTQVTLNINKSKYYLNNAFMMNNTRSSNYSNLNTNGVPVNQVFKNLPLSFSNEFNTIRTMYSKHIVEFYSYISHIAGSQYLSLGPDYNDTLFNKGVSYQQLMQHVEIPTWFTGNYISLKIPGRWLTQSFKAGFSLQSQTLNSNLNALQHDNTVSPVFDSAVNHIGWSNKKWYAEAAYDIPGNRLKARLALPLTFQQLHYEDNSYKLNKELSRLYFNPQLYLKYQTGRESYLSLQYSYRNETGSIEDIYRGGILKNYRTLYANSGDLTLRQNHSATAGFDYRKTLRLFFFGLYASYNNIRANNITSSIITNNLQQSVMLPYPNNTGSWSITGTTSKYSFKLHTTFSAVLQWQQSHTVQIQNGDLLPYNTIVKRLSLTAETKLNNQVNFSYNVTGTQINSHSAATEPADRINRLKQQASIYYEPTDRLQFKLSGEHYFTNRQGNADLKYFFADAFIKYHFKKWNADLQLDATNLLNVKTYNAVYLSANTLTASSYTLPGRIILMKFMFNL